MSETVVVTGGASEPDSLSTTANPSVERTIGQLETKQDQVQEQAAEAAETAEAAESTAEAAVSIAGNAAETAYDARAEVDRLRGEVTAGFEALALQIAELQNEEEDDQENPEVQIENDAPAAEPTPAEEAPAPKRAGILRKLMYGR